MIITQDWQLLYTDIYYISTKSATLWNSAVLVLLHSTSQCHKRQFNTVDSALRLIWENLPICTNEQVLTLLLGVANILNIFLCPAFQKCIFFYIFGPFWEFAWLFIDTISFDVHTLTLSAGISSSWPSVRCLSLENMIRKFWIQMLSLSNGLLLDLQILLKIFC